MCAYGGKTGVNFCAGSTENFRCVDFYLELDWRCEYIWYLNKIPVELTPPTEYEKQDCFPAGWCYNKSTPTKNYTDKRLNL